MLNRKIERCDSRVAHKGTRGFGDVESNAGHGQAYTKRVEDITTICGDVNSTKRGTSTAMDKQSLGARIATYRAAAGLTQERFAARLGWSGSGRLGNYEQGLRYPPLDELPKIASILGVTVDDLLSDEEMDASLGRRAPKPVLPAAVAAHTRFEHLSGFDKHTGSDAIYLPDIVVRNRLPHEDPADFRWIINSSSAMSPHIRQGALVLVDSRKNTIDTVTDGEIYAIRLWGRPDLRRIHIASPDSMLLVGDRPTDQRVELHRDQFGGLEIGGQVMDAI